MAELLNPTGKPLDPSAQICMPAEVVPSFRATMAVSNKLGNKFLYYVTGGMGDTICAEPAIRFACEEFKDVEITVGTYWPELFRHLPVKTINFFENKKPLVAHMYDYFCFKSLYDSMEFHSEFIPHMNTHVVDYCSLTLLRLQLPHSRKHIVLKPTEEEFNKVSLAHNKLVIHPGRTWKSRTIPAWWWNKFIKAARQYAEVVIIGATTQDPKLGVVDLDATYCVDLRNKLSVMESIAVCQRAQVVITNDSAPFHMASSGGAWIGVLSTVKHPDLLLHYRNGRHGFGAENLCRGGMWEEFNLNPNFCGEFHYSECTDEQMEKWLPEPADVAHWAVDKGPKLY